MKKYVLSILAFATVILGILVLVFTKGSPLNPKPPQPQPTVNIGDISSESEVFIPIEISSEFISKSVESSIPRSFRERREISISGVKDEHVIVSGNRDDLTTVFSPDGISVSMETSASASVKGKVRPVGPKFSQTANGRINLTIKTKPEFKVDWTVRPNLKADYSVPEMRTELAGIFDISLRTKTRDALGSVISKQEKKLNDNFPGNAKFKKGALMLWNDAHAVTEVSKNPPAWILTQPVSLQVMQPNFDENGMRLGIGLKLNNKVVLSDVEPVLEVAPLPDTLEVVNKPTGNNILISLPVLADFATINSTLKSQLKAKPIKFVTEVAGDKLSITVDSLKLTPSGAGVILEAQTKSQSGGFFGEKATGKLYFLGTPVLDKTSNSLKFLDLDYHVETKSVLTNSAAYLLKPIVINELKDKMVVDMNDIETELVAKSKVEILNLNSKLPDGLKVSLDPSSAHVGDVIVGGDKLMILIKINGKVDVRIDEAFVFSQ